MAKIRQSNLDPDIITEQVDASTDIHSTDIILIYDQSAGTLKKISQTNFLNYPLITAVSPTNALTGDGTGNHTFTITGKGFLGGSASLIKTGGASLAFDSVTVNSNTQITGVIAKSSLLGSDEPFDVKVTGSNSALTSTLENQINVDQQPVFVTSAGSLGSAIKNVANSFSVNATDPESHATPVRFELQSGTLPPGYTLTNTAAEGGTAIIAGTDTVTNTGTTFNFVLRAFDAASNTTSRAFSIAMVTTQYQTFTADGTFAVPSGMTSLQEVLVVAGGGGGGLNYGGAGGAGGLIFMPNYPVTPGGTISVVVGDGGNTATSPGRGSDGGDTVFAGSPSPGKHPSGDELRAKGGGGGGASPPTAGAGKSGGSGGGGGGQAGFAFGGGAAEQPTQPGDSGAYGFGNAGGGGNPANSGGGGGAGGAAAGPTGAGGAGRAYTIADGTTPVYYAGGGGGHTSGPGGPTWGQATHGGGPSGTAGQANKGGGSGGGGGGNHQGGKGVVIIKY